MKRVNDLSILLFCLTVPSVYAENITSTASTANHVSKTAVVKKAYREADLLGQWQCRYQMTEVKTKIKVDIDYQIDFKKEGKSFGTGDLMLILEGMPGFKYKVNDTSMWNVEGNKLTMSSKDMSFTNISHPQFDELLNLQSLFPKQANQVSTIIKLTKTNLEVTPTSSSDIISCKR